jgi:ribonuclease HI
MVVSDGEAEACGERLELLAVVRGLEALDGPSRVTLVTKSRYVSRGIRLGITEWRANDWRWERFGRVVPVKDRDLWQRVDRALLFHKVECQAWQFEDAAAEEPLPSSVPCAQVEAVRLIRSELGCSETIPNPCKPQSRSRLAPTKRRLGPERRIAKGAAVRTDVASPIGKLAAAIVNTATAWSDSLRGCATPNRRLVPGAA